MSQIDLMLAEIEARAKAATPGPWKARHTEERVGSSIENVTAFEIEAEGDACWIAKFQNHTGCIATKPGPANADFCAAARTDIPRLVAALRVAVDAMDREWRGEQDVSFGDALESVAAALNGE